MIILKTSQGIAKSLKRAGVIYECLRSLERRNHVSYLEIGTSFKGDEGLSTVLVPLFLRESSLAGSVTSIDSSRDHIEKSKMLLRDYGLDEHSVRFVEGVSSVALPQALESSQQLDFVFLDGGGDPLVNLWELMLCLRFLKPDGIVLVDDAGFMEKTTFRGRRDQGKISAIGPLFSLAHVLRYGYEQGEGQGFERFGDLGEGMASFLESPLIMDLKPWLESHVPLAVGNMWALVPNNLAAGVFGLDLDSNLRLGWDDFKAQA